VVYEQMSFKVKVYGRTTDGRKAITKAHHVTDELKKQQQNKKKTQKNPKKTVIKQ
jgi:hypothetical protein